MTKEKPTLLNRLRAKGRLSAPEGLQLSGETSSGNDKVEVSNWDVSLQQDGELASSCTVTPLSTKNPIWYLSIYATAAGTDKLAVFATAQPSDQNYLNEHSVLLAGWTDLYDPNVEGNVIDSLVYGFVKTGENTVENFSFEKTFVLQT